MTEIELFDYLHTDPQTDVILLYLEELRDGRWADRSCPAGNSRSQCQADPGPSSRVALHKAPTPPPATPVRWPARMPSCDAVFREAGIIRVDSIEEMFNAAVLYTYQPLPKGNRLAIVTNAGGPGVMATDAGNPARTSPFRGWPRKQWKRCAARCPLRPT